MGIYCDNFGHTLIKKPDDTKVCLYCSHPKQKHETKWIVLTEQENGSYFAAFNDSHCSRWGMTIAAALEAFLRINKSND